MGDVPTLFRRFAAACREWSGRIVSPRDRKRLLDVANAWERDAVIWEYDAENRTEDGCSLVPW